MTEARTGFACFGSTCEVLVTGAGAHDAVASARRALLAWHDRFTRFTDTSELSHLNAAPAGRVAVSAIMGRFVAAALDAADRSGGLVDATQLRRVEQAGYRADLRAPLPLEVALALAPARRPGAADPASRWREVRVAPDWRSVTRPAAVALDSGGIVKGLLADVLAETLARFDAFAVNCAGDLRIGGTPREVRVSSPFDGSILHSLVLADAAVATSGIGRRSWLRGGRPMHHLLDPATGAPAFTGIVQATAVAPTGVEAEWRAKAAVLAGPDGAADLLPHGGVLVFDDGAHREVDGRCGSVGAADGHPPERVHATA